MKLLGPDGINIAGYLNSFIFTEDTRRMTPYLLKSDAQKYCYYYFKYKFLGDFLKRKCLSFCLWVCMNPFLI